MLIYSMSVSVDGFIADRAGGFGWTVPNEEQFRFHLAQTRELGGFRGLDRDQDVRLARDLRALPALPRGVGLTPHNPWVVGSSPTRPTWS